MRVTELAEAIKLEVGQFEVDFGELSTLQYSKILQNQVAPIISKHIPYTQHRSIEASASPYVFTSDIPDWVSTVDPIDLISASSVLRHELRLHRDVAATVTKPTFLWTYKNPNLYLEYGGTFNVLTVHKLTLEDASPDDFEILNMDDKAIPYVIQLMAGYVLVALGRNRRLGKLTELPFELDSTDLVSEGREQVDKAKEEISKVDKWWLSV